MNNYWTIQVILCIVKSMFKRWSRII